MLYLDIAQNQEDFILKGEERFPYFFQKILYRLRKLTRKIMRYEIDGKHVVVISTFNKRIARKLEKIFQIDVTQRVCVCEPLMKNDAFLNFLKEKHIQVMNGRWLFSFLIDDIAKWICHQSNLIAEEEKVALLMNEPNDFGLETIKRLSNHFKNISIVTNKIKMFERIEKEIYEEKGLVLTVTNNLKKACVDSKIVFNIDFKEKQFSKIRFLPNGYVVNVERKMEIEQSNFNGKNIDFFTINLPTKYRKIYKRLHRFHSSILYESLIYKKTSFQNIWKEIANDKIEIIGLENCIDKFEKKQ